MNASYLSLAPTKIINQSTPSLRTFQSLQNIHPTDLYSTSKRVDHCVTLRNEQRWWFFKTVPTTRNLVKNYEVRIPLGLAKFYRSEK